MRTPSRCVMLVLVAAACGAPDNIQGPAVHAPFPPQSFQQSEVITLLDEDDGSQYTLDLSAQEIRFSDGRVLKLDNEQTTDALATFHGTIVADSVNAELLSLDRGSGCEDPSQVICDSPAQKSAQTSVGFMWRFVDDSKKPKGEKTNKKNVQAFGSGVKRQASADVCSDVATAALDVTGRYRNERTSIWGKVFGYAIAEAANELMRFLPRGSGSAVLFAGDVSDHLTTRTSLHILGFTWNSYNCSSRQVTAGPIIRSSGGGGRNLVCHNESVEISFDNGQTWITVTATVCEYQ